MENSEGSPSIILGDFKIFKTISDKTCKSAKKKRRKKNTPKNFTHNKLTNAPLFHAPYPRQLSYIALKRMINNPKLKDFTFPDISITLSHLLKSFKNALLQYYDGKAFLLFQITGIDTKLSDRSLKQLLNIFNPYDQDLFLFLH